jgi:amidohydrolase
MFQPAEEGGAGAMRMIEDGLLEGPDVDGAFALHVAPYQYVGQIAISEGPICAASDRFTIMVRGRGGHASRPHVAVDPIVIGAQIVMGLQTLVSREVAASDNAVITVGSLTAGTAANVIPDFARIHGTVRTYSPGVQDHIEQRIAELATGMARAMRGDADVEYSRGYPPLVNHEIGANLVKQAVKDLLGSTAVEPDSASMGGEDFAFVLQRVPGAMFRLGVRSPDWPEPRSTHSAGFDLDERALPIGTAVMAATALNFLNQ